ncbi:MAG: PAS sensor protein [Candidatus Giovannonibacteria bacterium GW2011_GWA2_44_26]|uniref:histidine kinase n=1 Tax=Candidatus Giovannonibacteria bacterium GW2011_GWA2_44_26 TaxID=1618648 RepID=A0A0G1KX22_9BACT|nr:MAG: PAS sensor protein [Candidatus Giovannonibacteria bacterium GW2011_GWA2_44_26]
MVFSRAQARVINKTLRKKSEEKVEEIEKKIKYLNDTEAAMLNILEDERALEERLKTERARFEAIVSTMGEGLLVLNRDYQIVLMNATAERLLETSAKDAVGQDAKNMILMFKGKNPLPDEERPVAITFKTGQPMFTGLEDNLYYQNRFGKRFAVAMAATPLRKEEEIVGAVVVFRDVTEEKKLDESRTSFISIASHQLRTPLTSIRWFVEMLLAGDAGPLSNDQKHFVSQIYESADRMIDLVNLLLQIARVEAGIEVKTSRDPLPLIPMDQEVVWQVVQNLLTNAIRYSPKKGVISVFIADKGNFLEYAVKDSGIGIPENQQSRVFEKFFRADNAIKEIPEGSGLGLALVKSLVEGWGGKVWFESKEGAGTIFYFTVPIEGVRRKEGGVGLRV